jgi:hypothetical protein
MSYRCCHECLCRYPSCSATTPCILHPRLLSTLSVQAPRGMLWRKKLAVRPVTLHVSPSVSIPRAACSGGRTFRAIRLRVACHPDRACNHSKLPSRSRGKGLPARETATCSEQRDCIHSISLAQSRAKGLGLCHQPALFLSSATAIARWQEPACARRASRLCEKVNVLTCPRAVCRSYASQRACAYPA